MIQWWQILLLTLYSAYQICDELTIVSSAGSPVFAGFITGLIMGKPVTGLFIGGSLQLFVLGVGTFGGASRIDATSGAVLATAFSVALRCPSLGSVSCPPSLSGSGIWWNICSSDSRWCCWCEMVGCRFDAGWSYASRTRVCYLASLPSS